MHENVKEQGEPKQARKSSNQKPTTKEIRSLPKEMDQAEPNKVIISKQKQIRNPNNLHDFSMFVVSTTILRQNLSMTKRLRIQKKYNSREFSYILTTKFYCRTHIYNKIHIMIIDKFCCSTT
jgi:hypothetical protein